MAVLRAGTSGWSYGPWRDRFYAGVRRQDWLRHYASRFNAVEVNASFYRAVRPATFAGWREATPETFRFAIKGHRFVTHVKRLADAAEAVDRQRDSASALHDRLAAVLWQLPTSVPKDRARLLEFLAVLARWPAVRHVIEFRNSSWFDAETVGLLAEAGVASAISDADRWPRWDEVTTDFAYVRLHGRPHCYRSPYPRTEIEVWAKRAQAWLAEGREVHVYFNNTMHGAAAEDAQLFQRLTAPVGRGDAILRPPAP